MKVFYSERHKLHVQGDVFEGGKWRAGRDVPERVDLLLEAACSSGLLPVHVDSMERTCAAQVHTPEYLSYLQNAFRDWPYKGDEDRVIPTIFATRDPDAGYPSSPIGRAGYHLQDQLSPIGKYTWEAALSAANVAMVAADEVLKGSQFAYALCRPSGHHASADMGGGATYLNNAAIAAQQLRKGFSRVALLDIDVHHGNGTQRIFYRRSDVLFISVHRDSTNYHPYFSGYSNERGEGEGLGYTLNLPLAADSGDDVFLFAIEQACQRINAYQPEALVVSLGFDAHCDDPARGLKVSNEGFAQAGDLLNSLALPTVLVQEGGYALSSLASALRSFLKGFQCRRSD